jgi:putative aldouronate transport system substrate-binding protein
MFIRQDWLDDLGLDTPATYDEYFEVLKAFAVEKNVKYPLAIGTSGVLALNNLASGYGIAADIADLHDSTPFYQVDGEVRFGLVQPEYKEYLQMLNEWYDAGVISSAFTEMPDFIFGNDYISCITNGEFGVWCTSNRSGDEWKEASEDPNFEATALPSVVKNEGDIVHVTGGQAMSQNDGSSIVITTQCENPEIAAQWVDIFYSDKGCEMMSWGIEGWSFIRDEDGEPRFTDLVVNNPDYTIRQMRAVCTIFIINARVDWIITAGVGVPKTELYDYVDRSIWASNNDYDYLIPTNLITMTSEESTEYNNILGDLQTYATECIPKFMNGEMDVDTQFDAFVKQLEDMGSDRLVEIMQSAYDRYLARGN